MGNLTDGGKSLIMGNPVGNPSGKVCAACTCLPTFGCVGLGIIIAIFIVAAANQMFPGKSENTTTGGSTQAWTTATLSPAIMDKINANKPTYILAATAHLIEWEMLAALHYREAQLRPAGPSGEEIGTPNPDTNPPTVLCDNFLECQMVIADKLKRLAKMVYDIDLTILSSDEDKKNAFLAYNRGFMYKNCEPTRTWNVSPYVMNQFDDAYQDMLWPSPGVDSNGWTCETIPGQQDANHGAFTVYVILKGRGSASSPGGYGGGFSGGDGAGDGGGGGGGGAN